jgi:hypothetical protein
MLRFAATGGASLRSARLRSALFCVAVHGMTSHVAAVLCIASRCHALQLNATISLFYIFLILAVPPRSASFRSAVLRYAALCNATQRNVFTFKEIYGKRKSQPQT